MSVLVYHPQLVTSNYSRTKVKSIDRLWGQQIFDIEICFLCIRYCLPFIIKKRYQNNDD